MPDTIDALLVYGNPYYNVRQHPPFGLDCLASFLAAHGHESRVVYPFLYQRSAEDVVAEWQSRFRPRIIGVNLRNIDPYIPVDPVGDWYGPHVKSRWFLPQVRAVVRALRASFPDVPLVLGGTGYSTSPREISKYLDCPAGVIGSGETAILQFLRAALESPSDMERQFGIVSGEILRAGPPVRFSQPFHYSLVANGVPIRTKIGCNRVCSYCTDPVIDGLKVITFSSSLEEQLSAVRETIPSARRVFITDSEFNLPLTWAESMAKMIAASSVCQSFSFATQVLPKPFRRESVQLLREAGFTHLLVTADGFSDDVHRRNRKSYRTQDILGFIEWCHEFEIVPVIQNVFGLPGETAASLRQTLTTLRRLVETHPRTTIEFTLGGRVYPGTYLEQIARVEPQHVYGEWSDGLLKPLFYSSPYTPADLNTVVSDELQMRLPDAPDVREDILHWRTSLTYYADSGELHRVIDLLRSFPGESVSDALAADMCAAAEYSLERCGRALLPYLRQLPTNLHPTKQAAVESYIQACEAVG
jgi:radical SAM superfamily enzyme YgiQ (UPF0313 family)